MSWGLKMTPQQALEILSKSASQYRGTLEEHQLIVQATQIISELLPKEKKAKPPK